MFIYGDNYSELSKEFNVSIFYIPMLGMQNIIYKMQEYFIKSLSLKTITCNNLNQMRKIR